MALDDFVDPEVGLAVAATALVFSPKVRAAIRRGLVVGLAGVMKAPDQIGDTARNVAGEAQNAVVATVSEAQKASNGPRPARSSKSAAGK